MAEHLRSEATRLEIERRRQGYAYLDAERRRMLPSTDTPRSIEALSGLVVAYVKDNPPLRTSGLVEWYRKLSGSKG